MSIITLLLACLLATPAIAADRPAVRSETLALRYLSAAEADRLLMPGTLLSAVPAGILAWTVEDRENRLIVTGSEEAIQDLKSVIRLLDVPPIQVRLAARVLRLNAGAVRNLESQPEFQRETNAATGLAGTVIMDGPRADELAVRSAVASTEMMVGNNRLMRFRWSPQPELPIPLVSVEPRVNGDGTVTLSVTLPPQGMADGAVRPRPLVLRRVEMNRALLLLPRSSDTALMLMVRGTVPPAPPDGQ